ncbi:MAG: IS66 family transposase [Candidatus Rhabdochlamydia sp.]
MSNPDHTFLLSPDRCQHCHASLEEITGNCVEKRQVFELPQPKIETTEYQAIEKTCLRCGRLTRASFPEHVKGPVQFGSRVKALASYLSSLHFIPVNRICQIFKDLLGISLSPGSCMNINTQLFTELYSFEEGLKKDLLSSKVLHFDETGMRCEKKLKWIHVVASEMATFYTIHHKRGKEAMDAMGILPLFKNYAVHDHWKSYFNYPGSSHVLCNVHHLRELNFIHEEEKEEWALAMKKTLLFAYQALKKGPLSEGIIKEIHHSYNKAIQEGHSYHAKLESLAPGKRGRTKQRPGKNLLDRLEQNATSVLAFTRDSKIPFSNNQGEQDIRMVKLKQKIGGCFRMLLGGQIFCRIRSYLSTARKQNWNMLDAITDAIQGNPYHLTGPPQLVL